MLELADEESDASHFSEIEQDEETIWPCWSRIYREAWISLRDDRFFGSQGGMGRIYYTALSQYARDHGIALHPFSDFVMAIDDEFVEIQNSKIGATEPPTD